MSCNTNFRDTTLVGKHREPATREKGAPKMVRCLALFASVLVIAGCQNYTTGLQRTVDRADETVAIAALHSIAQAQRTYSLSHEGQYATLPQLSEAGYLDSRFATEKPLKDYVLTMSVNSGADASFSCLADPIPPRQGRHFYIDSATGEIHANPTQPASAADPATQ